MVRELVSCSKNHGFSLQALLPDSHRECELLDISPTSSHSGTNLRFTEWDENVPKNYGDTFGAQIGVYICDSIITLLITFLECESATASVFQVE